MFDADMPIRSVVGTVVMMFLALRMRVHSVDEKKNILSFLIGPPTE